MAVEGRLITSGQPRLPSPRWPATLLACASLIVAIYLAFVAAPQEGYHWGIQIDRAGTVVHVDPTLAAYDSGVTQGDRVISARDAHGRPMPVSQADNAAVVRLRHPNGRPAPLLRAPAESFGHTGLALAMLILAVFFLGCGLIIWWRALARGTALHMLALCTIIALMLVGDIGAAQAELLSTRVLALGSGVYFPLLFASFFLIFPRNRLRGPRGRRVMGILAAVGFLLSVLYIVAIDGHVVLYPLVHVLLLLVFMAGLVTPVVSLAVGYRDSEQRLRQQRRIIISGTIAGFVPFVLLSVIPSALTGSTVVPYEQSILALGLLPLAFGYAILKYDLLKLDVVIRRAAVHSLFIGSLLCLYLGVIYLAGIVLAHLLSNTTAPALGVGPTGALSVVAATLVAGLVMAPLRALVQTSVERVLFPEIYRYNQLIREGDLPNEGTDLGVLADLLSTSVRTLLPVTTMHLFVRQEDDCYMLCPPSVQGSTVSDVAGGMICSSALTYALDRASWGCGLDELAQVPEMEAAALVELRSLDMQLAVPLRQSKVVTGFLVLGARTDRQAFSGVDRELLTLVAERYALAIDHAVLLGTLERQVRDISSLYQASAQLTAALRSDQEKLPALVVEAAAAIAGVSRAVLTVATDPPITIAHSNDPASLPASALGGRPVSPLIPMPLVVGELPEASFDDGDSPVAHLPLRAGDTLLGRLHLDLVGPHRFGAEEKRLLAMFANQAAVALEHAQLYGQAVRHAEREPLTGLYNHRMITTFLQRELARARHDAHPLSILIMDVKGFKLFNDTYGHLAGDQLLKKVAQVLETCSRQSDFAGRTGGDEFTVLLPHADQAQSRAIAERIHAMAAAMPYETADGGQIPLDLNIGVACYPADGEATTALLTIADERMYAAKRSGSAIQGPSRGEDDAVPTGRFGILEALVAAVDNKDSYTAKHSDQVARFALALASELGASQETLRTLRVAGLLHDVGKIGVPDRVLRKPGRLSDEEREIMEQHAQLSEMLVRTVMPAPDLLDAVRYHHERWDGRGYPYKLAGEQVPLLGRVMIVADAVSAMIMDRPYRKGLAWDVVCAELRRGAGTQFDPSLVEPFISAISATGLDSYAA